MKNGCIKSGTVRVGVMAVAVVSGIAVCAIAAQFDFADLITGNQRFVNGAMQHPNQTVERRLEVAHEQHPHAIVLTCADSRVAPEIVFDQGLGDLFVVRVAGNVVDAHALASMEYAVEHLHCERLVVMGHERCGAVQAAVDAVLNPAQKPNDPRVRHLPNHNLDQLLHAIQPAVRAALKTKPADVVDAAVRLNIKNTMNEIQQRSPILQEKIAHQELEMVGAYYDLDDGTVLEP